MWEWIIENKEWLLSGVGIAIILSLSKYLSLLFKKLLLLMNTHWVPIYIQVNNDYLPTLTGFHLLHVERGGYPNDKTVINVEKEFKSVDYKGTLRVRVPCLRKHGFVFKCFVDYGDLPFEIVTHELQSQAFTDISKADGMDNRAYFILPEYRTIKERFLNNEFLPS